MLACRSERGDPRVLAALHMGSDRGPSLAVGVGEAVDVQAAVGALEQVSAAPLGRRDDSFEDPIGHALLIVQQDR